MEIVNYLRVLRRRWRLVAVLTVLGVALGATSAFIGGQQQEVSLYKATITLTSNGDKQVNLSQLAVLTTETEVSKRAAAKLGGSPAALSSQVSTKAEPQLDLLKITAVGSDPTRTVQVADTFGQEISAYQVDLQQRARDAQIADLERQKQNLAPLYGEALRGADADPENKARWQAQYDDVLRQSRELDAQIARLRNQASAAPTALTVISTAEAVPVSGKAVAQLFNENSAANASSRSNTSTTVDPQSALEETFAATPTRIGPIARAGIGGAIGLLLGAAIALVIERIDPRIRTKQEAEDAFGWPVITETPPISRKQRKQMAVLSYDAPRSRFAEAYRSLRSAVLFACAVADGRAVTDSRELPSGGRARPSSAVEDVIAPSVPGERRARVVMITSPSPSEGKTTTTSNLAAVLAEAGFDVLVINCDFRRPRVHAYLHADGDTTSLISTPVPRVSLLSRVLQNPDLANPAEVVAAQRDAIDRHRNDFDFILLDTAPLLSTNDAAEVLDDSDLVVVVGKTGQTTKEAADRAAEMLERRNAPVVGVVLVGATDRPSSRYYYYGDARPYYEDGYTDDVVSNDRSTPLDQLSRDEDGETPPPRSDVLTAPPAEPDSPVG